MSRLRRNWRRLVFVVAAFVALPYALIFLYAVPFVRPVSTLMLRDLVLLRGYDRQWVEFEDISPTLVQSVMMSEDGQYCRHAGVDWGQMRAVVNEALAGEQTRGASTIPMQTAKNLFLWNGHSFVRKGIEAGFTVLLELSWPKRSILEVYLNIAEFGRGVYGVQAASIHYFNKPASKLSRVEAARLAAILPQPIKRDAASPGRYTKRYANRIAGRTRVVANEGLDSCIWK